MWGFALLEKKVSLCRFSMKGRSKDAQYQSIHLFLRQWQMLLPYLQNVSVENDVKETAVEIDVEIKS